MKPTSHELQTERAIIGILLRTPLSLDSLVELAHGIKEDWFLDENHRLAYAAMMQLGFENGRNTWDATVVSLATKSKVDRAYLTELQVMAPHPSKLEAITKELRDQVTVRRFRTMGAQVAGWDGPAEGLIQYAQTGFLSEIDAAVGNGPEDMETQLRLWNEDVDKERSSGGKSIVYSGIPAVDRRIGGFRPGEVYYFAGRPGTGKTALAINIAAYASMQGHVPCFFSLEMLRRQMIGRLTCVAETFMAEDESELILDSGMIRTIADMDVDRNRGMIQRVAEVQRWMAKHCNIFTDYASVLSSAEILAKGRRLKRTKGLGLMVVDYVQLMSEEGRSRTEEIGIMTKGLKRAAKELEIPVIALAQMNRGIETRDANSRPVMADLREGGAIENDADYVGFLYQHESQQPGDGIMELINRKVRSTQVGTDYLRSKLAHFRFKGAESWEVDSYLAQMKGSKVDLGGAVQMR